MSKNVFRVPKSVTPCHNRQYIGKDVTKTCNGLGKRGFQMDWKYLRYKALVALTTHYKDMSATLYNFNLAKIIAKHDIS